MVTRPREITESHLRRRGVVYVRQSSMEQVRYNTGSTALQFDLRDRLIEWGWPADQIDVVDDDLGVSGSVPNLRQGFSVLLDRMQAGMIGAVSVMDSSRLGRNALDLVQFSMIARQHDVLLVHANHVVDFRDPNSEFMGMLQQLIGVRENRLRIDLMRRAKRKKVESGLATTTPPVGYVMTNGSWAKHPDPCVRDVLQLVFDKFFELGSLGRVVRDFRRQGTRIPRRRARGTIAWEEATRAAIHKVLGNPGYAGMYVYGQTVVDDTRPPTARGKKRYRRTNRTDWVILEDHHEPYVAPARWRDIQARLAANQWKAKPPLGRGDALVQGLLRCTVHQITLRTCYPERARMADGTIRRRACYMCQPLVEAAQTNWCARMSAQYIDTPVEAELFKVLTPPSLAAIREVGREATREHEAHLRTRQAQLHRAEQTVASAEREFDQADPEQRHLRRRLGERLDEALRRLAELRTWQTLNPVAAPVTLDDQTLEELHRRLDSLPTLWRQSHIQPNQRKALVRAVIRKIHVTPRPEVWTLEIEWVGGARTTVELVTPRGVQAAIREDYHAGLAPKAIAERLSQRGIVRRVGANAGQPYDEEAIRAALRRAKLQKPYDMAAATVIRSLFVEGTTLPDIASQLNARGIRHYLGLWTNVRVQSVLLRLRRGDLGGDPLPPVPPLGAAVKTLHAQGLSVREIASRLNEAGVVTLRRRPVTLSTVCQALARLGLEPHSAVHERTLVGLLRTLAPTVTPAELVERVNALGLPTRMGGPWTLSAMYEKLRCLGLRVAVPRPRRRRTSG